jgi:putative transcriptional regulator
MFDRNFLINKVVNSLLSKDYQVLLTHGCFDIATKREILLLIKILINIDGLNEKDALSLRSISYFLSASPVVISVKNNREFLDDKMIYSRFQLPVVTPQMFDNILEEEASFVTSSKGRHAVAINAEQLKNKRKKMEFTLEELSGIIGISKKALYEIENKRVNPSLETVQKLENILKIKLMESYKPKETVEPTYLKPTGEFQEKVSKEFRRIGIDNSPVYHAPFEIIGKEKFSLITSLSNNIKKIEKDASKMKSISSVVSSKCLFISKKSKEKEIEGIPVILESELPEIETSKDLKKIMKEKV